MGCGASTAARVGPEPTEIIEALDSSTETKATLCARLNGSLCLAPALRPVLWPRLLDVGSSNTPDFAALLERAGGDAGGGIDASYLKTIDADVPRTDRDEDAFRDADGAGPVVRHLTSSVIAHPCRRRALASRSRARPAGCGILVLLWKINPPSTCERSREGCRR